MRYLDPKNDLIFKRVFGEHPHIVKSFLNALLPLAENQQIEKIEYLPTELVPEIPGVFKNSIVDVRCIDNFGRQFIVEMQMLWTDSFKSRVLFNASKAYIKQMGRSMEYNVLQPVYALSVVNEVFEKAMEDWYHHYKFVHNVDQTKVLEGLELIFIELPKVKTKNYTEKKLSILWMRYLYEIENLTDMISEDLLSVPEIAQAIELTKESSFSLAELEAYDKYWDAIRTEKTFIADALAKGEEIGISKGEAIGIFKKNVEVILSSFETGLDLKTIAFIVKMTEDEVSTILKENGKIL